MSVRDEAEAMSSEGAGPASERQIARIGLAAERDYLAAALAFLREVAGRLGLAAPDVAGLARVAPATDSPFAAARA